MLLPERAADCDVRFLNTEGVAGRAPVFLPELGPVYTDSSALNPGLAGYGSAAFAAVQLRGAQVGEAWAANTGVVPAHLDATAAAAERLGLAVAALYVPSDQAVVLPPTASPPSPSSRTSPRARGLRERGQACGASSILGP